MDQWIQENVKFEATINQWHTDAATQWQQHHGVVASGIEAAVDSEASNGKRENFLIITTINWWQRLPVVPCSTADKARIILFKQTINWGKWQPRQKQVRNSNAG